MVWTLAEMPERRPSHAAAVPPPARAPRVAPLSRPPARVRACVHALLGTESHALRFSARAVARALLSPSQLHALMRSWLRSLPLSQLELQPPRMDSEAAPAEPTLQEPSAPQGYVVMLFFSFIPVALRSQHCSHPRGRRAACWGLIQ
jgi:hypothetical protein